MRRLAWWMLVGLIWWSALWRWPALPGPWGAPDGLLLALLGWVLSRRRAITAPMALGVGAVFGFLKDLASSGPVGGWVAIFAVTAWGVARADRTIARDHPLAQFLWVALCAAGTVAAYAGLLAARGTSGMTWALLGHFAVPSAVVTALGGLLILPLVHRVLAVR